MWFAEGVDDQLLGERDRIIERESSGRHPNIRRHIHSGWWQTARSQSRVSRTGTTRTVHQRTWHPRLLRGTVYRSNFTSKSLRTYVLCD